MNNLKDLVVWEHGSMAEMTERTLAIPQARRAGANKSIQRIAWIGREFEVLEQASHAIHADWQEGLDIIADLRRTLAEVQLPKPKTARRTRRWSEDNGDSVDNDRLRSGQEYWSSTIKAEQTGPKTVSIHVAVTASSEVDSRDIFWRGAAAVTLAEWLQEAGYRVRITGYEMTEDLYVRKGCKSATIPNLITCVLKDHADPFNVSLLVNALSGWCFRTTWFAAKALGELEYADGLGYCASLDQCPAVEAKYFAGSLRCERLYSESAAIQWLQQNAAKFAESPELVFA
jgi:hypothetical protein